MPDSPINPSNFPNPAGGGGPTPTEIANLHRKIAEEAKKLGITLEKSYIDAYKKITKVAEVYEKQVTRMELDRLNRIRAKIGTQYAEEFKQIRNKDNFETQLAKKKEKLQKDLFAAEKKHQDEIAKKTKELGQPGFGKQVVGALGKEITSLPLVGGFASTLAEVGPSAAIATGGIAALVTFLGKLIESMFKMNIAATRVDVGLTKAGISQDFYNKKLAGAFQDIPKALAGPEDFAKWISTLSAAPKALKDLGRDNQGFETFLGHMGALGVTFDESVQRTAKAALTWGGTFKDLDKEFLLAKKLTKDTGLGFDTLYDAMQDLNPVMKQLTFSSDEATKASMMFVNTMMKEFAKMGMAPEEARGLTEALGNFIASMSGSKILGLQSLMTGMPKDIDKFFSEVSEGKVSMTELWRQSTQKIIGQMPKGMKTLGVMGMAEQGMLPAMFSQPKFAVAMSKLVETGGTDKAALTDINSALSKQEKEAADRAKGFETLANLNTPFENLAKLLQTIVDELGSSGPLVGYVRGINDVVTAPQRLNPLQLLSGSDIRGTRMREVEQQAKTSVSQNLRSTDDRYSVRK